MYFCLLFPQGRAIIITKYDTGMTKIIFLYCDLLEELKWQESNQICAYLSDIFTRMNDMSISIQGKNISILNCHKKLNASKISCLYCVGE